MINRRQAGWVATILALIMVPVLFLVPFPFIADWPTFEKVALALMLGVFLTMLIDFLGELGQAAF